jgi:hypothetical protein
VTSVGSLGQGHTLLDVVRGRVIVERVQHHEVRWTFVGSCIVPQCRCRPRNASCTRSLGGSQIAGKQQREPEQPVRLFWVRILDRPFRGNPRAPKTRDPPK